jgi:hypothetical protein
MNQRTYGYRFIKYGDPQEVTIWENDEVGQQIADFFLPDQESNPLDELLKD